MEAVSMIKIKDRPYCSQKCLLGLAVGGALDDQCPNLRDHRKKHIQNSTFLRLIRVQLAIDRGSNPDCTPLYIKGARGALFKVRLSSHGYTLVAKGMEKHDHGHLLQESEDYTHLRPIQGDHVPVCLGIVDLKLPYYYDCGVYVHMLFLSWAGRPLHLYLKPETENGFLDQATTALKALHGLQVLHRDAELRNMVWDEHQGKLMLVDSERAEIRDKLPWGSISPNRKRSRQGGLKSEEKKDDFEHEIRRARASISWSLQRFVGVM